MKPSLALVCTLALAGCAATPAAPPGAVVADARIAQALEPGVTTKAMLLARFGPTTSIRFDNGVEVWRYLTPGPGGKHGQYGKTAQYGEYVIVFDARGVVARSRFAPVVYQWPQQK